jgi:hypothetical protein
LLRLAEQQEKNTGIPHTSASHPLTAFVAQTDHAPDTAVNKQIEDLSLLVHAVLLGDDIDDLESTNDVEINAAIKKVQFARQNRTSPYKKVAKPIIHSDPITPAVADKVREALKSGKWRPPTPGGPNTPLPNDDVEMKAEQPSSQHARKSRYPSYDREYNRSSRNSSPYAEKARERARSREKANNPPSRTSSTSPATYYRGMASHWKGKYEDKPKYQYQRSDRSKSRSDNRNRSNSRNGNRSQSNSHGSNKDAKYSASDRSTINVNPPFKFCPLCGSDEQHSVQSCMTALSKKGAEN